MAQDIYINNRKVLFITTKNLDYIRNVQEIRELNKKAEFCQVIGSRSKYYSVRLLVVYIKLLLTSVQRFDTVFLGFAPQMVLPLWGWKFRGKKLIIDFFISFYDTLCYDRKKVEPDSMPGRWLHRLDESVLGRANLVICDTMSHRRYFTEEFHVSSQKFVTLYLEADTAVYHPLHLPRPEYLRDKYIVLYFGSGLPLQGIDIVLKAINLLKDQDGLYFFFIGSIKNKQLLQIKPASSNIEYIEWVPQSKLAEYIDWADLCLAGHFSSTVRKASRVIPGKAFIYQAMGKKMILGDNEANHERFADSDKNLFVAMGNERELADGILQQMKN